MSTLNLADGESFVKGRSTSKAAELIGFAGKGNEDKVRTTSHGYIVPTDILPEGYAAITNADLPAVRTEPGTPTHQDDVFNKAQDRTAPVGTALPEADDVPADQRFSVPEGAPVGQNPAGEFTGDQGETYFSQGDVDLSDKAAATAGSAEAKAEGESSNPEAATADAEDEQEQQLADADAEAKRQAALDFEAEQDQVLAARMATEIEAEQSEPEQPEPELYDPTAHTVAEVKTYLETADDAEHARVLNAESASTSPRKGVLDLAPTEEGAN